jgi:PGF-CTERM protein
MANQTDYASRALEQRGKGGIGLKISRQVGKVIILVVLAVACMVAPMAARIGYSTIQQGDIIFIYEKHLDVNGLSGEGTITRLVHYADLNAGTTDDFISVTDPGDFNVPSTVKFPGTPYYAWNSTGLISTTDYVIIEMPEISLDIVSGVTLVEKLTNMTIIEGTSVTFRIISNVPNGFNLQSSPPYVELRFTTPEGGQTTAFGGVNYGLVDLTNVDIYVSETDHFTVSDTTNVEKGIWNVQARWLDTGDFTSFYGEGVDSNVVSFTIASVPVILTTVTTAPTVTIPTTATPAPPATTPVPPATTPLPATTTAPVATTPVPTTTPGFGAVIALIGLGAVALLFLCRR